MASAFTSLFILLFTNIAWSQENNEKVISAINSFVNHNDFKVTELQYTSEGDEKKARGAIEMWGHPGVELDATITGEDSTVKAITLSFPAASNLSIGKLNGATGGVLTSYLPAGFPLEAGVAIKTVGLNLEGSTLVACSIEFGTADAWQILGSGGLSLNQILTKFTVEYPKDAERRKFVGDIIGFSTIGGVQAEFKTSLTNKKEDIAFAATLRGLGIKSLINSIASGEQSAGLLAQIPAAITNLKADELTFTIWPMGKRASCYGVSTWGDFDFQAQGLGSNLKLTLALAAPSNFKFSDFNQILGPLDGMDMDGTSLIITSMAGEIETSLKAFESTGGKVKVVKGINVIANIAMSDEMEKLVKTNSLQLSGSIGSDLKSATIQCALEFADLGSPDVQMKNIAFGFEVGTGKFDLFLRGNMEITLDGDVISFTTELRGSPIDLDIQGSLYLQALQKAQQAKQEATIDNKPYWEQPFGVPHVAIGRLGGSVGVSPKSAIGLSSLGLTGEVRMGSVPDKSRHIYGSMDVSLDIANPGNSLMAVDVQNLNLVKAIEAFIATTVEGSLRTALDWGFDSSYVYIVPVAQTFLGKQFDQGIAIGGKLKIAGISASCDFRATQAGASARGTIEGIKIEPGGVPIFKLTAANGAGDPSFDINLNTTDPRLKVDGSITLLGVTNTSFIDISKSGFTYKTEGKILGGGLQSSLTLSAPTFSLSEGLYVKAAVAATTLQDIAKGLTKFIEQEHKKNAADIKNAESTLANTKGNNEFEQAFIDGSKAVVGAVGEMERAAAVIGTYISDGLLGQSIVVNELSFAGGLSTVTTKMEFVIDMTIAGSHLNERVTIDANVADLNTIVQQIFEQVGDEITNVFAQLGNEVTDGFETFVEDAEVFFGEVEEGFAVMGDEIMTGINYIGEQLNINFNREGDYAALPGPENGNRPQRLAPALTRYRVSVASIVCQGCKDAVLYPACEFYGNVVISTNINGSTQNSGSNQYLYKGSHEDIDPGDYLSTGGPVKDVYIPDDQLQHAYITVVADFWEDDDGWDDEEVSARTSFFVGNIESGGSKGGDQLYVTAGTSSNQILIRFNIARDSKPANDQMVAAARAGLANELNLLANQGGNLLSPGIVSAAIESRNATTLNLLYEEGNRFAAGDLTHALQPNWMNLEVVNYILARGVFPQREHMDKAVAMRNVQLVQTFMANKAGATEAHLRTALANNDREMAKALLKNKMAVPADVTQIVIDRNDIELLTMLADNGSVFTQQQLYQVVGAVNNAAIDQVLKHTVADHQTLQIAAEKNNTELFRKMSNCGARLDNNLPTQQAINNNNIDILKASLDIGADPSEALKQVVSANKEISWVNECLKQNANPDYALSYAVANNNKTLATQLIGKGASADLLLKQSVDAQNVDMAKTALSNDASPLPYVARAAILNNDAIVKLLVDNGGNPNDAMKPMVEANKHEMVHYLIENGASAADEYFITKAAYMKSVPMAEVLCQNGADPNLALPIALTNLQEDLVRSMLHLGASPKGRLEDPARYKHIGLAKALLEYGADANEGIAAAVQTNQTDMTSLMLQYGASPKGQLNAAAANNNIEIVTMLLEAGADCNEGMQGAMNVNNTDMARLLLSYGASPHGYMATPAQKGNMDIVTMLLDAGADANDGLAGAITGNHNPIVELLLKNGAQVKEGMLKEPALAGNLEMVTMLVDAGANPEEGMPSGVAAGHTPVVVYLISKGADGSKQEYIIMAVNRDYHTMIPVLIKAGGNKDYRDADGNSFLHVAAEKKYLNTLEELAKAGLDINSKNNAGNTVLHVAGRKGRKNIMMVMRLVELGADVNAVNNKNKTVRKYSKSHKVKKFLKSKGALRKIKKQKAPKS
ncbi:MAG: ankyrin repeat domain-containing protein [Flavobacteriales bacterium]